MKAIRAAPGGDGQGTVSGLCWRRIVELWYTHISLRMIAVFAARRSRFYGSVRTVRCWAVSFCTGIHVNPFSFPGF